jgi:hypothetical protein
MWASDFASGALSEAVTSFLGRSSAGSRVRIRDRALGDAGTRSAVGRRERDRPDVTAGRPRARVEPHVGKRRAAGESAPVHQTPHPNRPLRRIAAGVSGTDQNRPTRYRAAAGRGKARRRSRSPSTSRAPRCSTVGASCGAGCSRRSARCGSRAGANGRARTTNAIPTSARTRPVAARPGTPAAQAAIEPRPGTTVGIDRPPAREHGVSGRVGGQSAKETRVVAMPSTRRSPTCLGRYRLHANDHSGTDGEPLLKLGVGG